MGTSRMNVIALVVILSVAGFGGAADADSAVPAVAVAAPAPDFDAATAARLAVNRIEPLGVGLRLHHPRRQVDFTPEGIRVSGRRGTSWSWQLTGVRSAAGRSLIEAQSTLPAAAGREKVVYDHGALQEEYLLGIEMPWTFSPPIASAAMAATSAESMPPEMPNVTERNPFLRT